MTKISCKKCSGTGRILTMGIEWSNCLACFGRGYTEVDEPAVAKDSVQPKVEESAAAKKKPGRPAKE